ncbi:MAG: FAD-dependent oxidoreductase [Cyanobacteria bacterium P01_F01_bin.143]
MPSYFPTSQTPRSPHLVLIGGGHSHAIALNLWSHNPIPGVKITLISDVQQTPYSGMLPGHVAGFYSYEETHINLVNLCQKVGVDLIIDRAIALDLANNQVICQNNDPINFDYLSIDIGSTPDTITVPGATDYAIPAKPVPKFLDAWSSLLANAKNKPQTKIELAIVGGGAGGVELVLNMQTRLRQEMGKNYRDKLQIHLIHRGHKLLSGHNSWVSKRLHKILIKRGITLHLKTQVTQVNSHHLICDNKQTIDYDYLFWVTQASAPEWIKQSPLATDSQGFLLVKDTLCSVSHPNIFATGDIATMKNYARPKAGVFAVRQGKPLFTNWQNILKQEPLISYIPQKRYLALIGTGDKKAIASWGSWGWQSSLFWLWKDYIDRKFMNLFKYKNAIAIPVKDR